MKAKKIAFFALLSSLAVIVSAQTAAAPGFGPTFGRNLDNLAVGTTLTHEVKIVAGKALFTDRLIPVFAAEGKEYEIRLPMMAFSGVNLKQNDTLEIQGVFTTLKTPDGKVIYSVFPQIVKIGGKEINLEQWRQDHKSRGNERRDKHMEGRQGQARGPNMAPGMGPMNMH